MGQAKPAATTNLLDVPPRAGRAIVESEALIACPLLGTDRFVDFCRKRGLSISHERLLRFERLGLFAPVFRVRTPRKKVPPFSLSPRRGENWFTKRWAWDTTGCNAHYTVPDPRDRSQEGYYSIFQVDDLAIVTEFMNLKVELEVYLEASADNPPDRNQRTLQWLEHAQGSAQSLRKPRNSQAIALLCQAISNRYYPQTQGDQRVIRTSGHYQMDNWVTLNATKWDWHTFARQWNPKQVRRQFRLTPEKLRHAFEALAITQAHIDPLEAWYQLVQFVALTERERLQDNALRAETIRSGAHMLRMLHKDLYGEDLPHPNEVSGTIITHMPELEVRQDTRRYLELVVNRYALNPQPRLCLIVEGLSEERAITKVFNEYFGAHAGIYGIEIIALSGVDAATGGKDDRFRAILRLIDYLHHHQTFTFLILDNEGHATRLKSEAQKARSIHGKRSYITRREYIKIWRISFEFDNFSCTEIAAALNKITGSSSVITRSDVAACKRAPNPGACLNRLASAKYGYKPDKIKTAEALVSMMLDASKGRRLEDRPIIQTLERVERLAVRNPLPVSQEIWETNQISRYLGKKRARR